MKLNLKSFARAKNVLSAAQFCAHFGIVKSYYYTKSNDISAEDSFLGQFFIHFSKISWSLEREVKILVI